MDNTDQISAEEKSFKTTVLVVASFVTFITAFMASSSNLALPSIGKEFKADAIQLGWVMSSHLLSSAVFLLPFGRLGDIIGQRKIFFWGIFLYTISTFLIIFSLNITALIIFRILQGIAGAMVFGTSMAIIAAVFKTGERGRAMGINITATYLGLSLGPIFGGILTQYFGWRSIFIVIVPFEIVSLIIINRKIKSEWANAAGEKFDWKGSIAYGLALFGFMYGFSKLPSLFGWICLAAGLLLALLFVLIELKVTHPVFEIRLMLNNRVFAFSSMAALINYAATSAIGFFISLYLQYLKGFDARTAGLIMISQPVAMALLSPLAGRISDKKNPGVLASAGMGVVSAGLVMFCFINENTHVAFLVVVLTMLGLGFGLFSSPNTNAIMSSVEKKYLGIASGVYGTVRLIGQTVSMGIAMMLLSLYIGKEAISPSTYPGLILAIRTSFLICAILSAFGIFASLARNKPGK